MQDPRVVILGGGFAGLSAAKRLQAYRKRLRLHVTLVSNINYILFTPMLPEVATDSIEARHIAQPLRAALKHCDFVMGNVRSISLDSKRVIVEHEGSADIELGYDHLVLALGSEASTFGLPGVERYTFPLKTLENAAKLRDRIIQMMETAAVTQDERRRRKLLTFVIVGGGFTGVEFAGELNGFLRTIRRFYRKMGARDIRVVLVEADKALLPQLPERFGKRAHAILAEGGVEIRTGAPVAWADENGLSLRSGERFDSQTVVWTAGVRPSSVVAALPVKKSKNGAVVVCADFSVPGHPGLWALGDCAQVPEKGGGHYAPTAQNAIREGPLLGYNIAASLRGRPSKPFGFKPLGMMASLGDRQGLADLPGGRLLSGLPAWLLWRSYYLGRLPGLDRKARVFVDWAMDMVFSRDIARLRS